MTQCCPNFRKGPHHSICVRNVLVQIR